MTRTDPRDYEAGAPLEIMRRCAHDNGSRTLWTGTRDAGPGVIEMYWYATPASARENPCRVFWGSHGCDLERGHKGDCDCGCCECENHPDPDSGCVATVPYYGPETRFYGEDVKARGLPEVDGP